MSASAWVSSCRSACTSRFASIICSIAASRESPLAGPASSASVRSKTVVEMANCRPGLGAGRVSGIRMPREDVAADRSPGRLPCPLRGTRPLRRRPPITPPPGAERLSASKAPGPGPKLGSIPPGIGPRLGNSKIRLPGWFVSCWARADTAQAAIRTAANHPHRAANFCPEPITRSGSRREGRGQQQGCRRGAPLPPLCIGKIS